MPDNEQLSFLASIEAPPSALLTPTEIFQRVNEELLVTLSEDNRLERKPGTCRTALLGQYISMWANTAPDGGVIVVGMADNGAFDGLNELGHERLNKLERCGRTYCPDATGSSKRVPVTNLRGENDFVLVMRVPYMANKVVKTNKGDAFVRRADQKHKLTPDEVRELKADKREISFELEECNLQYPSDFNRSAIHEFTDRIRADKSLDEDHSDEDVLTLMHLGKLVAGDFKANVACALLFADDPRLVAPGCRIRFLRFDGDVEGTGDKWNAVKDIFVEGTVGEIITKTADVISSQVRTFSRLGPKSKFYTQPEYPPTAWYEAVVNACVHRSYGNGLRATPVFVKMFDNRLVIESPGPFPPFVTPENIYYSHHPKNPFLMEALRHLEFVKCAHEGTRRMRAVMSQMKLPDPEFRQDQIGHFLVRVTLRNNVDQRKVWVDQDVADMVGAMIAKSLTDNERRFLNFVAEHGEISVSDAQRLAGLTWPMAKKQLMKLVKRGILRHDIRENLDRDPQARFRLDH